MTETGYSGRPQARKLGLKAGQRVVLHDAPEGWALTDPPDGLAGLAGPDGQADVIVAFFTEAGEIGRQLGDLGRRIYPAGALWIAWPRRAGGHRSDITDNVIREHVLPLGLVDVKVAAIDEDWSGLRVVWRTENRRLGSRHCCRVTEVLVSGRGVTMAAWVSLDVEGLRFPFSPSRWRSSSPTSWSTGPRAPRSRSSGVTWG
jgi:hypothetical protein